MKTRVAVIGCGSIAEFRHAPEYSANPDVEIAAFCDPVLARAQKLADRYGGQAFSSYTATLELPGLDAASVCTSNSTHAEISIHALRDGLHVLCEKPIATSLADARQMILEAERAGKTLMVAHNQRFAPAHMKARELLQSGALGRVLSFRTTFGHSGPESWGADKGAGTWFFRRGAASLGALGDLGVHKIDLIRFLLEDEIDEVSAITLTAHKKYESGEPIDVEDNAVCILRMRGGAAGTLAASWTYYGAEDNSTMLYCEGGVLKIYASQENPLVLERKGLPPEVFGVGAMQTNDSQMKSGVMDAFIRCIRTGCTPPVTGLDGYEALSAALACGPSSKAGAAVRVNHFSDEDHAFSLPHRLMHVAYAVHNLRMETNITPERVTAQKEYRYCDESYPSLSSGHAGKPAEGRWQRQFRQELGGSRIN